ncbi:MAG: DUF2017 family protein [Microbacterium ginsengisoli]|uniref:DUF2017 family protein n=1 Tax=Microbacterium TaxID=33882 RepID=UPI0006F3DDF5|nr:MULTISPECIES: DUF2017 family protein [unclassified Microbacterium]MBN9197257.1 DUF2017 family protein [Microbacterium ginsengisoli]KQR92978.1 hypothetical protein ASG00_01665 [Microbacterium sp. Leaf351]KQS05649.1 hypothetical protein ASF93_01560 [Microbacterium sp. Leaf347]ODU77154.1 MAG: hypothetical protein ABT08_07355 [Microbacterium sp. SCN 71-21]OJU77188.1 MAG: hypothetical protein BGO15_06805 [Microbacterium sp. 71-23]
MTTPRLIVLQLTRIEAAHLQTLVTQFAELVEVRDDDDPAVARLTPDAYPDDARAASDFRDATQDELLRRRSTDAAVVTDALDELGLEEAMDEPVERQIEEELITLDPDQAAAWLRTLAAIRLVLATRLGVTDEDSHDDRDPRFGIYDWVGFRLDGLVKALDEI